MTPPSARAQRVRGKRGPELDGDWKEIYIGAMETLGARWRAARVAGVSVRTVDGYMHADPVFAERARDAKQLYLDDREIQLKKIADDTNNPLPLFGILKAERPDKWNDRIVTQQVNLNVALDVPAEQILTLFQAMAASLTPPTLQMLQGARVIDMEPA